MIPSEPSEEFTPLSQAFTPEIHNEAPFPKKLKDTQKNSTKESPVLSTAISGSTLIGQLYEYDPNKSFP